MTSNNLDFVARCMIGRNTKDIKSLISEVENIQNDIGGVKIMQVTKEDYDALTDKPTNVIYLVSDGDKITLYTGDEPSGTVTNVTVANGGGLTVSGSPITTSGTITVGHSNSVTAKTNSSLKKFTYDAYGHVTGSSELSTDESNALASGIDSTKVAQITTNKNNILTLNKYGGGKNILNDSIAHLSAINPDATIVGNKITVEGVEYTINSDGTITIVSNGTNTQSILYLATQNDNLFQQGQSYTLSGVTTGGSTTYDMRVALGSINYFNRTEPVQFTYGGESTYSCIIVVRASQTVNITISPMICTSSDYASSPIYQPYAMSNSELTAAEKQNEANISLIQQVPMVESADDGKVLTANYDNETGTYSWQPVGGGGTTKYMYNINIIIQNWISNTASKFRCDIIVISENPDLIDYISGTKNITYQRFKSLLKYSSDTGYAIVTNMYNMTINKNANSNADFEQISFVRYNHNSGAFYLQTPTSEIQSKTDFSNGVGVIYTKTEI